MVEQLGLAMMPLALYPATAWGLTSGTTSGTCGSMRQALELSTTTHPSLAASGANRSLVLPPAENSAMSMPLKQPSVSSWTGTGSPLKRRVRPTERAEARKRIDFTGKSASSRQVIIWFPTAPVAPATATLNLRFAIYRLLRRNH